jgi:ubiquitin carboxyl-terminal hydrolase 4/11/15
VIRQGEGILLDWRLKKAQEVFGTNNTSSSSSYSSSYVNDAGWKEIDQIADPNAEMDEKKSSKKVTLMDCMDEFTKEEELSEEDLWYCPQCKQHQRATKKFDIWHLPEIMVVHLKRFSHTRTLRDKIDALIDFPMEALDMTDRVLGVKDAEALAPEDRFVYDLYAVDNHFGGLGGGHCKFKHKRRHPY